MFNTLFTEHNYIKIKKSKLIMSGMGYQNKNKIE